MKKIDWQTDILARLAEVQLRRPELRFGQVVATVGLLGEDESGRSLWELEDDEFAAALERFAGDLAQNASDVPTQNVRE